MKNQINKLLQPLGWKLVRSQQWDDPKYSYMLNPEYREELYGEIASLLLGFAQKKLPTLKVSYAKVIEIVEDFFDMYSKRPYTDNSGGSGFHNSLWLYFVTRLIKPELIVESGVWKGLGTYILHQANPEAQIYCFDLSFGKLLFRNADFVYVEHDWSSYNFEKVDPEKSLCFFDCHVNQAKRIREAYDKGFKYLIFDDNFPLNKMYGAGMPGIPSVDMLMNSELKEGQVIEWVYNGKKITYTFRNQDLYDAKDLVKTYAVFPDVSSLTRYNSFSGSHTFSSFVELKR